MEQKEDEYDAGETKKAARIYLDYLTIECVNNGMCCMPLDGIQLANVGTREMVFSG